MASLKNLSTLRVMGCHSSLFQQLPADLCSSEQQKLTAVRISSCSYLATIPACLGKLSQLETLNLFNNTRLNHVPAELSKCTALKEFVVEKCENLLDMLGKDQDRLQGLAAGARLALVIEASTR